MSDVDLSFAHLDDRALAEHISNLFIELNLAERELYRRKAVLITKFPRGWREPPKGAVLSAEEHHWYVDALENYIESALANLKCRPGDGTFPWAEVWGLPGSLGPIPLRTIRDLVRSAHEHAHSTLATRAAERREPER
ncbi:MAG TPA: hypothetical protein VF584_07405 [Longimicrobium sp.]|jgi:hypothetical protein